MTEDEILDCRYRLLYKAEYSARYHRRRAAFLSNSDTFLNLVTIVAGASTFGDLVSGSPGWLSKLGAATVTLLSVAQIVLRLGARASEHAQWLKRWTALHSDISLESSPDLADIRRWTEEQTAIETECIGELRALCLDCENAAARFMSIPNRQVRLTRLQRIFIHFGTFQSDFPKVHDTLPAISGGERPKA